jgi:hypothetical protein
MTTTGSASLEYRSGKKWDCACCAGWGELPHVAAAQVISGAIVPRPWIPARLEMESIADFRSPENNQPSLHGST